MLKIAVYAPFDYINLGPASLDRFRVNINGKVFAMSATGDSVLLEEPMPLLNKLPGIPECIAPAVFQLAIELLNEEKEVSND